LFDLFFCSFVVSPDGQRAAFDGRVSSGVTRIFVLDLGTRVTTRQRNPASGAVNDSAPAWVNSSSFIFSSDEGGNDQVYRQAVGSINVTLAVPLAIEPAYVAGPMVSVDAGVSDGGVVDGGP
jgi:Tol biopolymer transport system component